MMNTKLKIGSILLVVGIILFGILWIWTTQTDIHPQVNLPQEQGRTWVSKHLTQCAEEWQPWVYQRNKDKYTDTEPFNKGTNLILMDEGIKDFYKENYGIIIYDIRREHVTGQACEACHCLSDTKLFLQIADKDVSKMLELGYTK